MIDEEELHKNLVEISKRYRLNPTFLREIVILRNRGFNNSEISERTGIARITVNNYVTALEKMPQSDLFKIILIIIGIVGGTALVASIIKSGK